VGGEGMKRKTENFVNSQYSLSFDEEDNTIASSIHQVGGSMTSDEKSLLRHLFKNKIYEADGQKFEDLFTKIMNYVYPDFKQIKPKGSIGDRKNDGYIESQGIYFQVYAPEDIANSYTGTIKKLESDFKGLMEYWNSVTPVKEFYFVVNDKYKGIYPDSEQIMTKLKKDNNLNAGGFKTAKDLENLLFSLADDKIQTIAGFAPDPAKIKTLDYSILNEVIDHIKSLSLAQAVSSEMILPDWNKKIKFNKLSPPVAMLLNNGSMQIVSFDRYLNNQGNFLQDELRNKMNEIYISEKNNANGDDLFWNIVRQASPMSKQEYQLAVIVIMAKYFESCDILERPLEET
jgi:hypothetical protein